MKILFLTSHLPDKPTDGIKIISYHLIRMLRKNNDVEIDLVVFTDDEAINDVSEIKKYCNDVKIIPVQKQHWLRKCINIMKITPNQVLKNYNQQALREFITHVSGKKYDCMYVMPLEVYKYAENIQVPCLLNTLDAHSLREWRQCMEEPLLSYKKYYSLINYLKMLRYENQKYPDANACILVSEHDADYLKKNGNSARIEVIPNGVDTNYFDPEKVQECETTVSLVFTGDYAYKPNESAALYLYERIYKRIRKKHTLLKLRIVGKNPTNKMRDAMNDTHVEISGFVEDIRPYLKAATVFVCPLAYGAGMKNKILEAVAMKVPVVCSEMSANGLELLRRQKIISVVQNESDYIREVTRLLDDEQIRREIGEKGRQYVIANYSWQTAAEKTRELAEKII